MIDEDIIFMQLIAGSVSVSPMLSFVESEVMVEVCATLSLSTGTMTANDINIRLAATAGL